MSAPLAADFRERPLWHDGVVAAESPGHLPPGHLPPGSADVVIVGAGYCGAEAAAGLAERGRELSTTDAVVSLAVFVVVASISVAFAVIYEFVGGERAKTTLDELKEWMTAHNSAVMAVLFLVFGVVLISKGMGPLSV